MCRRAVRKPLALTILSACLFAAAAAASSHETVCEGFDRKHRISRLGGRAAFSRTPVTSPADLLAQLEEHRAEVEALMAERGLGHLVADLYAAVKSGEGLSERNLERGEVFEWMAFRKRRGPETAGPLCVSARKTYDAYVIEVAEVENHPAQAKCELKATGGACVDEPISVDAGGSSAGVVVEMSGAGGTKTVISGGATTWEGTAPSPGAYGFTARAEAQGTKTVTTHTFVIPKICLNLAYEGDETEEQTGDTDTCSATAQVDVKDCAVSVTLSADPLEVKRRESIQVDVSGSYDSVSVTFKDKDGEAAEAYDAGGNPISELTASGPISFRKPGTYTLEATAQRCQDLPEVCRKTATGGPVDVEVSGRWTARFFGLRLDPDEGPFRESLIRPDGVRESSHLHLDGGVGVGAGLEYHFNPRIGLEGSLLYVPLETELFFDLDDEWESGEDDMDLLAFLIGPNFHLTPDKKVDFYVGLFVGAVDLGSTSYRLLGETQNRSFDADTVFGAQLGLDIPFGSAGWAVHLGARYMDMTVETAEEGPEVAADPLSFEVGFAYSF